MIEFTNRQIEIIKASGYIISNLGLKELTMKNIAKHLGITEPAIYRHFENKEKILLGVLDYFQNIIERNLDELNNQNELDPLGKIEYIFIKRFETFNNNPEFPLVIFCEEILKDEKTLAKKVMEITRLQKDRIKVIVIEGQKLDTIRNDIVSAQIVDIIVGIVGNTIREWMMHDRNFDIVEKGKETIENVKTLIKKQI